MTTSHLYAELEGLRMHYVRAGEAPDVVVLLHGWAQTWYEWRHIIPELARRYPLGGGAASFRSNQKSPSVFAASANCAKGSA